MPAPEQMTDAELEAALMPFRDMMFEMVGKTVKDNKERGFRVCWNEREQKPELYKTCTGTKCGVPIERCPGASTRISQEELAEWEANKHLNGFASFHTHPRGGGWCPSPGDVVGAFGAEDIVDCVGVGDRKKKGVACYRNQRDFEKIKPFIQAWAWGSEGQDYEKVAEMMGQACFVPSDKTLFRRIFIWEG